MRERTVEQHLIRSAQSEGGLALKWVSPGAAGIPDRLVLLPGGKVAAVEVKRPGSQSRPLQLLWLERLARLGLRTGVVDSLGSAEAFVRDLQQHEPLCAFCNARALKGQSGGRVDSGGRGWRGKT